MSINKQKYTPIDFRAMHPIIALQYLEGIRQAVANKNYEHAHALEDAFHRHLIEAISLDRCTDTKECAKLAMETQDMEFERWCA